MMLKQRKSLWVKEFPIYKLRDPVRTLNHLYWYGGTLSNEDGSYAKKILELWPGGIHEFCRSCGGEKDPKQYKEFIKKTENYVTEQKKSVLYNFSILSMEERNSGPEFFVVFTAINGGVSLDKKDIKNEANKKGKTRSVVEENIKNKILSGQVSPFDRSTYLDLPKTSEKLLTDLSIQFSNSKIVLCWGPNFYCIISENGLKFINSNTLEINESAFNYKQRFLDMMLMSYGSLIEEEGIRLSQQDTDFSVYVDAYTNEKLIEPKY